MQLDGPVMLSLCDRTTLMCEPWAEAGYTCLAVDIRHPKGITVEDNIWKVGVDIRTWLPPIADYAFVAAFPPCTNLASSGARWFRDKGLRGLIEGLELVERARDICEWSGAPWMLENPVSTISTYWRKPDHTFSPNEYAGYPGGEKDDYSKVTCLWTGGGFKMPKRQFVGVNRNAAVGKRVYLAGDSSTRDYVRSATPKGFARAVFEAHGKVQANV